ncbi:MAG: tRNA 4-thiouridine(8) synthase ThiI, partial [Deltaproteobacteria bacterium]|nr:tRNA 4-thiouridine(8) synthase ThiI [Deltaproteobacteria bacterium]
INREDFLELSGRSRKPQIDLARKFGVTDYPAPAGGCLLCDKIFSIRLKDLFDHSKTFSEAELHLLKYGRHFRIKENIKIIVGRTQKDNVSILKYYNPDRDIIVKVKNFPGPITLIPHAGNREAIKLAASICAGYSKAKETAPIDVSIQTPSGQEIIKVRQMPPADARHLMI